MSRSWFVVPVILSILAMPGLAAERRHGVGIGYVLGTVDYDLEGSESIEFSGYSIFGKVGFSDHWGLALNYVDMKDDEDLPFGEEDAYSQLGLHGVFMFRPEKKLRPHLKLGLSWVDVEAKLAGRTFSDDAAGLSGGFGLEWGSPRYAFYLDIEFTDVSVELVPGAELDLLVMNTTLGFIYKF